MKLCSALLYFPEIGNCLYIHFAFHKIVHSIQCDPLQYHYINLASWGKNITSDLLTQNLEKEKRQLESAVNKLTQDLDKERGQNNLLSKQVTELEKLLDENKVA